MSSPAKLVGMADASKNHERVANGGMVARAMVAMTDGVAGWAISAGLALVVLELTSVVGGVPLTEVRLTRPALALVIGLAVSMTAVLHAVWTSGLGGPVRRAVAVQVVDARTYASIGFVQALYRVAVRELVFVTAVVLSAGYALDRLPAPGVEQFWYVAGWLMACRFAPPALAWFLPRGRGIHDLAAGTLVIHNGPFSRRPVVEAVLLSQRSAAAGF